MKRAAMSLLALALFAGCDRLPGKPIAADRYVRPSKVNDFATLYEENCAGCHGDDQRPGASVALAEPVYLGIAPDEVILKATAEGVPGTSMPPFARSAGGTLTDDQVKTIVRGLRKKWGAAKKAPPLNAPPYAAPAGNAANGAEVYATYCSSCHGIEGRGSSKGGPVIDGSYLALVSDQYLRTAILVGRPKLGMPDWRGYAEGRAMTSEEVADVVAWLASKRPPFPGQPYARAE
jgi:mono/diheme cytochrome c family protein